MHRRTFEGKFWVASATVTVRAVTVLNKDLIVSTGYQWAKSKNKTRDTEYSFYIPKISTSSYLSAYVDGV